MSLRKKIEHNIRHFRSYILPSHRRSARNTRIAASPIPLDKPLCVIDFKSIKIDNVTGRYLYHLVTEFEAEGYAIAYTDRFRFLATMEVKACKKLLLSHKYSIISQNQIPSDCAVLLTDHAQNRIGSTTKVIRVVYDHSRPPSDSRNSFSLPFFVHPLVHESEQVLRLQQATGFTKARPMRILFAGNAKAPKYDAPVLAEKYHVLSRVKALATAEEALDSNLVRRPGALEQLVPPKEQSKSLTIATTQDLVIPNDQWLETLALADFYFACPGVEMPLCHNLIESLAAGAIPILEYPQYMDPPLTDGTNCLVYNDEISLAAILQQALTMSKNDVQAMRLAAQEYYKTYLQPGKFAQQLINVKPKQIDLFLNAYRVPILS